MARIVFILGAGASRHTGAPLMNEFLEAAWDVQRGSDWHAAVGPSFDLVRLGVDELQKAHSKSSLDIWNVETVFDAFEMAALVGRLGDLPSEDVARLPEAMRDLIVGTIEPTAQLPGTSPAPAIYSLTASAAYERFVKALGAIGPGPGQYAPVISFNYDVCLDYAIALSELGPDYCLSDTGPTSGIPVMKLHGSLNWAYCDQCDKVVPHELNTRYVNVPHEKLPLPVALHAVCAARARHADHQDKCHLLIVPPTLSKAPHHQKLRPVWEAAARALSEAEHILVCGYSLPETDLFFRYLFAVGSIGGATLRRFWVWDPDPDRVEPRFRELLGPQVTKQPERFKVLPQKFEDVDWQGVVSSLP